MGYTPLRSPSARYYSEYEPIRKKSRWILHLGLFILTVMCTVMAGTAWAGQNFLEVENWSYGLQYSLLLLTFLSAHEFGHYFAARAHGIEATLPYFIPMPPLFAPSFGTMGAVIRTQSPILTRKALFDIGIAGPLAGFVVCVIFLVVGFATLPPKEFIYTIHPEYRMLGGIIPTTGLYFGDTVLYHLLASLFTSPDGWLPPMNEMYHYPLLCTGWFGLLMTVLNLMPVGQLDGGHIAYAMFGERQVAIGKVAWLFIFLTGLGSFLGWAFSALMYDSPSALFTLLQSLLLMPLSFLHQVFPSYFSAWGGWLFWAIIVRFVFRIPHPELEDEEPLDKKRMILGWSAAAIFVLCFSFNGIYELDSKSAPAPQKPKRGGVVAQQQVYKVKCCCSSTS